MDFLDWCTHVLLKFSEAYAASGIHRTIGIHESRIGQLLDAEISAAEYHGPRGQLALVDALQELRTGLLLEKPESLYKPASVIRSGDPSAIQNELNNAWATIASRELTDVEAEVLKALADTSQIEHEEFAELQWVSIEPLGVVLDENLSLEEIYTTISALADERLISWIPLAPRNFKAKPNYDGLAWVFRRGMSLLSQMLDQLVAEWETTSVEFKREIHTNIADEKAELVRDILALANTRASGEHLLIVGFEPATHGWVQTPDPKITQDHLEDIVSEYTAPTVKIRYEVIGYRAGPVGRLKVLRNPLELPYKVKRSIGEKRRILVGQVFVRHNSHVAVASQEDLDDINEEREWFTARRG